MFFLNKDPRSITEADLELLIQQQVPEDKYIEYKRELTLRQSSEKIKFLSEVAAFANTSGGILLYGMKAENGIPMELPGLSDLDPDQTILKLDNIIQNGIEPRIAGINILAIRLHNSNHVILLKIPKSWLPPHMLKENGRFYSRRSAGKFTLDVGEIRTAFLLTESIGNKIKGFQADRLGKIISDEPPIELEDNPKIVFHVIPYNSFDPSFQIDLNAIDRNSELIYPIYRHHLHFRYNFDGVLIFCREDKSAVTCTYLQIFRNGILEATDAALISSRQDNKINMLSLERELIEALRRYTKLLRELKVDPPFFLMLSLIGVKNYDLDEGRRTTWLKNPHPIDRDNLIIPEVILDNFDSDATSVLKPVFDTIWNAGGWQQSMNYDVESSRWLG